jgi:c-di-GMP phosphodiesterase
MDKIRIKATLLSILIVLLLIGYFLVNALESKKRTLDEKILDHHTLLQNSYKLSVFNAEKGLNYLGFQILTDHKVINAFEARDRDALYRLALPYFNEAYERGEVDLTGFIRNDGIHFLRLTDPKKFGDNIADKRPMIAEAIRTRKPIASLDVTLYNISFVTLIPIFKDNRFLGIFQASVKINRLQEHLDIHSGIKSALAFDGQTLHQLLPDRDAKKYGEYALISSNSPLFESLSDEYSLNETHRTIYDGRTYMVAPKELRTYSNKSLAKIICALDITEDEIIYKQEIRELIVVSIFVLILLSIVLHFGFKALIDQIHELSSQHSKQLHYQLYNDSLTRLPNRKALYEDLSHNYYKGVMLLNIDNFKEMNDLYGHEIGDKILAIIGNSLQKSVIDHPLAVYKMHADEYALALTEPISEHKFTQLCQEVLHTLNEEYYDIDGIRIFVTLGMGAAICFEERCDLIGRADMALKTAKKRGISFVKYHEELHIKEKYSNNILWSKKLKDAIDEHRFALYYQGIHDSSTQTVLEYEALIRIIDKDGSVISPAMFLEIAKKTRLYRHITHFVINEIFQQLHKTTHAYSINLSLDDILNQETQNLIYKHLKDSDVGNRLIFEILESEGIENFGEVSSFITHVKHYGCKIAIDDFGSGYSNFAYLMRLNVDYLKIDGSLIKNLDIDLSAQDIVRAIVEFAKRLDIRTIAEFVSTGSIYEECKELGIDYIQGYYLSEPKPIV